jgi:hypothetical protein
MTNRPQWHSILNGGKESCRWRCQTAHAQHNVDLSNIPPLSKYITHFKCSISIIWGWHHCTIYGKLATCIYGYTIITRYGKKVVQFILMYIWRFHDLHIFCNGCQTTRPTDDSDWDNSDHKRGQVGP